MGETMNRYLYQTFQRPKTIVKPNQRWISKHDHNTFLVVRESISGTWRANHYTSDTVSSKLKEEDIFYISSELIQEKYIFWENIDMQKVDA